MPEEPAKQAEHAMRLQAMISLIKEAFAEALGDDHAEQVMTGSMPDKIKIALAEYMIFNEYPTQAVDFNEDFGYAQKIMAMWDVLEFTWNHPR